MAGSRSVAAEEDAIVAPALLSLVLRELNERRLARGANAKITADLLDLEQTKILESFYLRSLEGCPDGARLFVEDALLTAGGYRNSCALDDALSRDAITQPLLDELVNRRLLAYEDRHRTRRVELTHDVLVPVIKASRDARRAREERERAAEQEREALAKAESARAEAEQKARTARRQLLVAVILVAIAAAGAGLGLLGRSRARAAEMQVKEAVARGDVDVAILLQQNADAVAPETLAHLARALRTQPDAHAPRELLVSLLRDSPWCLSVMEPLRADGPVIDARFTDEGRQIVTASRDGVLRRWDAAAGTLLGTYPIPERIQGLSEDGRRLITAAEDKTVQVWDTQTGKPIGPPIRQEAWGGPLATASVSADGKRVVTASGGFGGDARVWNAETGEAIGDATERGEGVKAAGLSRDGRQLMTIFSGMDISAFGRVYVQSWTEGPGPKKFLRSGSLAVFSEDGRRIVIAGEGGAAQAFDVESGQARAEGPRHGDAIASAAFSPDGQWVISGSRDNTARIWDAETGEARGVPLVHESAVLAVSFSRDGQRVVTVSQDNAARVWNAENGQRLCEPLRHEGLIATAFFSTDGARALTASEDRTARLWNLDAGEAGGRPLSGSGVFAAAFTADGADVIQIFGDGRAETTDAGSGEARGTSPSPRDGTQAVALGTNGQRLVLFRPSDSSFQVSDTRTGRPIGMPIRHTRANRSQLSADGTRIVTWQYVDPNFETSNDGDAATARLWDVQTGGSIGRPVLVKPGYRIHSVAGDGRMIVTAPDDNTAQMWDAMSGQPLGQQLRHDGPIHEASFSSDGEYILTASDDRTARVWHGRSGEPLREPLRHREAVRTAGFSHDGTRIVAGSGQTLSIWDAKSGKSLSTRLRHDQAIVAAAFSSDNQRIVTLSGNRVTHVWDIAVDTTSTLPDWVPELAEALGGQRFDDDGLLAPARSIVALREELMTAGGARALTGDDFWSRFGRWFFTRGTERTISPNTNITAARRDAASRSAR